jgi:hypothetical protein
MTAAMNFGCIPEQGGYSGWKEIWKIWGYCMIAGFSALWYSQELCLHTLSFRLLFLF